MVIELKEVIFTHSEAAKKPLLDISCWSVAEGQQAFVHGPSGSGKSTLLNLLSGVLTCSKGEVSILGERLDLMSSRQRDRFRADHIGYVFQRFNLIPYLSATENIDLANSLSSRGDRKGAGDTTEALLSSLNVDSVDWARPTSQLSMGQQQRVAIARALVNRPQLLIADEPTSSLDQQNRDNFVSVLMSLVAEHNMTLLFVSHDMTLATHFDRVQAISDISKAA